MDNLLIRSRKVQTDALNEALDSLGSAAEDSAAFFQEIQWLIEDCIRTAGRLKAAFDRGQKRWAPRPVEDVHLFYTGFLQVVDGHARLAGRIRDKALNASEATPEAFDLKPLDESILALLHLKETIVGLCEWLIAPVPAPDEPFLSAEERRAAFEGGDYEAVEDILNRLRQGGPLVKE